jgi:hypothetical protein
MGDIPKSMANEVIGNILSSCLLVNCLTDNIHWEITGTYSTLLSLTSKISRSASVLVLALPGHVILLHRSLGFSSSLLLARVGDARGHHPLSHTASC